MRTYSPDEAEGLSVIGPQALVERTTLLERLDQAITSVVVVSVEDEMGVGDLDAYEARLALERTVQAAEDLEKFGPSGFGPTERGLFAEEAVLPREHNEARACIYHWLLSGDVDPAELEVVVRVVQGKPWVLGAILDETQVAWVYATDALYRSKWPDESWRKVWLTFRRLVLDHGDKASQSRLRKIERTERKERQAKTEPILQPVVTEELPLFRSQAVEAEPVVAEPRPEPVVVESVVIEEPVAQVLSVEGGVVSLPADVLLATAKREWLFDDDRSVPSPAVADEEPDIEAAYVLPSKPVVRPRKPVQRLLDFAKQTVEEAVIALSDPGYTPDPRKGEMTIVRLRIEQALEQGGALPEAVRAIG